MNKLFLLLFYIFMSFSAAAQKDNTSIIIQSEGMKITVDKIAQGFSVPWAIAVLSADKLLVTEREGSIYIYHLDKSETIKLKNTPDVMAQGQGGMLDVVLSPDYKNSGWIYFTYVKDVEGEGATVLARARLETDKFKDWQELLITQSTTDADYHFGSRITFDEDGHVYFGIGDRGERPDAQNLMNHAGTVIRLNLDGSIPDDNPFNNTKSQKQALLPEIWSYGHRNPQGIAYDFNNKRLWSIEHGPRGGDEINLILPAHNYGWPVISYGKEYWGPVAVGEGTHREGMTQPVKVYIPSIAPGSLIHYSGNLLPGWKGNLFAGALALRHINRLVLDKNGKIIKEERLLEELKERIRAITQSPEGWIYFSTDSGDIYQIKPLGSNKTKLENRQ